MALGFNQYLPPRYFAPSYFGNRFFGIPIQTPGFRTVTVREEVRLVTVEAADEEAAAASRVVVSPFEDRTVIAPVNPAYWTRR